MKNYTQSQSWIYYKNNPSVTRSLVKYGFTIMETFREALKNKMLEKGLKPAELARRSGVTKQNIGRILNDIPHPVTNAPPTTTRETVEKLAIALNWEISEALNLAGYASKSDIQLIRNRIRVSDFDDFDEKDLDDIAEYIALKKLKNKVKE